MLAVVLPALLHAGAAAAQEQTAARKFGRGAAGVCCSVLEIPGNMIQEGRTTGPVAGMTYGLALGLGKFVAGTLVGVYELLSAPFELPAGFEPILEPEYPWDYFETSPEKTYGFTDSYTSGLTDDLKTLSGVEVTPRDGSLFVAFPNRLQFELGSAKLGTDAQARLGLLADVLQRYLETHIIVRGYTDNTGDESFNLRLSGERAEAVRGYLISRGVASSRILSSAYGQADPVADNTTAAGRERNRRVELELRPLASAACD
jgi:putative exosortase-associated protein (TIGR04073 family)